MRWRTGRDLGFLEGLGRIRLDWAGDYTYLFSNFFFLFCFLLVYRMVGGWVVGWLMSEFAVCRNGGDSLGRLGALLEIWLVKLVDNIILVLSFSFSSFISCFCVDYISF